MISLFSRTVGTLSSSINNEYTVYNKGTLTINEQTAKKILLASGEEFDVEGTGYNDNGKIIPFNDSDVRNADYISTLGFINNEAMLEKSGANWDYFGDSIDIAFLAY